MFGSRHRRYRAVGLPAADHVMCVGRRVRHPRSPSRSRCDRVEIACAEGVEEADIGSHLASVRAAVATRVGLVRWPVRRAVGVRRVPDRVAKRIGADAAAAQQMVAVERVAVVKGLIDFIPPLCAGFFHDASDTYLCFQ
jgi:hypothetical protein